LTSPELETSILAGNIAEPGIPLPGADGGRAEDRAEQNRRRRAGMFTEVPAPTLPVGTWDVIVADPPWRDSFGLSRRATELRYALMSSEAIKALDVASIATKDSGLYLWVPPHMLELGLTVMREWGFSPRSNIVWDKEKIGCGQWARNQHEHLLIGRRGKFRTPPPAVRSSSIIRALRGKHSAKPEIFAELIERWYPTASKIELFRRGPARPGWTAWGVEALPALDEVLS
jgi:N6-adenosine-specific RNA methylase IME4